MLKKCKNCGEPEKTKGEHPKGGDFGWFDAEHLICLCCGKNPLKKSSEKETRK